MKPLFVASAFGFLQASYLLRIDGHPLLSSPLFPSDVARLGSLASVVGAAYVAGSTPRPWLGALLLGALSGFGLFEFMHFVSPLMSFTRRVPSNLDLAITAGVVAPFVALFALGWTEAHAVRGRSDGDPLESRP